jgi:hypothetical protein
LVTDASAPAVRRNEVSVSRDYQRDALTRAEPRVNAAVDLLRDDAAERPAADVRGAAVADLPDPAKRASRASRATERSARSQRGEANRRDSSAAASAPAAARTPSAARDIAQSMLPAYGWSQSEFTCLDALWIGESDWQWNADNPTSSAYGIPQSLPGEKMATAGADWLTNPATQIEWGLGYIRDVYGTPCAANAFKVANNWY